MPTLPRPRPSLLQRYGAISLIIMVALAAVIGTSIQRSLLDRAMAGARRTAVVAATTALQPVFAPADLQRGFVPLEPERLDQLDATVARIVSDDGISRVRVWNAMHWVVYSGDRGLVGRWFPSTPAVDTALSGEVAAAVVDTDPLAVRPADVGADVGADPLADASRSHLVVAVPLAVTGDPATAEAFDAGGDGQVVGAIELHLPYGPVVAQAQAEGRRLLLLLGGGLLLLWLLLLRMLAGASRRLRHQVEANTHLSLHDQLTGLPNRGAFVEQVQRSLDREESQAVVLIDLTGFKQVNDTLGHGTGDQLLRQVADRLSHACGEAEHLSRMGGDEFGIHLPGLAAWPEARARVTSLLGAFAEPFDIDGFTIDVGAVAGIALAPPGTGGSVDRLLQHADIALSQARFDHRPYAVYDRRRDAFTRERLQVAVELRQAVERDELVVHYQPQFNLRTGRVHSVEALIRWHHPRRGLLLPAQFLAQVEQTDLMPLLTRCVLRAALAQCQTWRQAGLRLRVSVNLSAWDAMNPALPTVVEECLAEADLPPDALTLELTESALLTNPEAARDVLDAVDRLGVEIALDDFGTGYASLATLRQMPVAELKIDRSIIRGITAGGADADVVQFTVDLGRRLNMRVVAEGTETMAEAEAVGQLGCAVVQGYHLTQPLDGQAMTRWLREAAVVGMGAPRLGLEEGEAVRGPLQAHRVIDLQGPGTTEAGRR